VLSSLGHLAGNLFGLSLFYTHGGWPFHEALLVMGLFSTLQGMSRLLIEPIDIQFWLSTRCISPWGLPDVEPRGVHAG
jgi:ABC-2 type transport system permease protein